MSTRSRPGNDVCEMHPIEAFEQYFEVIRATSPAQRQCAYRLRYQVYCVENPFEQPSDNPGGMEIDEFDDRATTSLLSHRPSGEIAGTVRLIMPSGNGANPFFPIQDVCPALTTWDEKLLPARSTAEISRFLVSKSFRRRVNETRYADVNAFNGNPDNGANNDARIMPFITVGLMLSIVEMSVENGITHWCGLMEAPFLRLLNRFGIRFNSLGKPVHYHGRRQPCYANAVELLNGIEQRQKEIWRTITLDGALVERIRSFENTPRDSVA